LRALPSLPVRFFNMAFADVDFFRVRRTVASSTPIRAAMTVFAFRGMTQSGIDGAFAGISTEMIRQRII